MDMDTEVDPELIERRRCCLAFGTQLSAQPASLAPRPHTQRNHHIRSMTRTATTSKTRGHLVCHAWRIGDAREDHIVDADRRLVHGP
jgi:hypothetical protein